MYGEQSAAGADAVRVLAERREVRVVVHLQRDAELLAHLVEQTRAATGQMHCVPHPALFLVVHSRRAHHRARHLVGSQAGVGDDLTGGGDDEVGHGARTAAPYCAHRRAPHHAAVQIGDRHPQPAAPMSMPSAVPGCGSGA